MVISTNSIDIDSMNQINPVGVNDESDKKDVSLEVLEVPPCKLQMIFLYNFIKLISFKGDTDVSIQTQENRYPKDDNNEQSGKLFCWTIPCVNIYAENRGILLNGIKQLYDMNVNRSLKR